MNPQIHDFHIGGGDYLTLAAMIEVLRDLLQGFDVYLPFSVSLCHCKDIAFYCSALLLLRFKL